ncbi:G-protein coupled receptor 4-like [Eublepharis macularius]|uniref:G-protein coupled receptor 4-like n=1 Tax=Eublepharis macularius TaxID=481883 RepID=A0AA97JSD8_EUBMA|nr:G-protein coupled receptor 4-like [Eublepharis macularius]
MNTSYIPCPMAFNTTKYFIIPVFSIVLTAGLPLNFLALLALVSQIKSSIVLSVYILNLVLASLLQTLTLPFWIAYTYHDHHWNTGQEACVVVAMIFLTNFYAKNSFLCLIAMERYIGLVHPLKFHRLHSMCGAFIVSIATWLLVAAMCGIGLWLQMKGSGTWQEHCLDGSQLGKDHAHFKMATLSLSFFKPCILMGFFYSRVLTVVRKVESLQQRVKRKVCGFIFFINISFFLLCIPFQATSWYKYYWELMLEEDKVCDLDRSTFIYTYTTWCLTTLDNILNPLLYTLLLKDVWAEIKDQLSFRARGTGIIYELEPQDLPPHSITGQTQEQLIGL